MQTYAVITHLEKGCNFYIDGPIRLDRSDEIGAVNTRVG